MTSRIAAALHTLRTGQNLTRKQLSDSTNLTENTIYKIESGAVDPKLNTMETLLGAMGYRLEIKPAENNNMENIDETVQQ